MFTTLEVVVHTNIFFFFQTEDNLDLSVMQRCEIISVEKLSHKLKLRLQNDNNNKGACIVEGVW